MISERFSNVVSLLMGKGLFSHTDILNHTMVLLLVKTLTV